MGDGNPTKEDSCTGGAKKLSWQLCETGGKAVAELENIMRNLLSEATKLKECAEHPPHITDKEYVDVLLDIGLRRAAWLEEHSHDAPSSSHAAPQQHDGPSSSHAAPQQHEKKESPQQS